jgi:hypothetical protein
MQHIPQKFSNIELLEIFPEALTEVIPEKIKELEESHNEIMEKIKDILRKAPPKDRWFYEIYVAKFYFPDLFECEKNIGRLKSFYALSSASNKNYINFEDELEKARQYPILSIAERGLELKKSGNNYFALCPFHNEKSASFCIYTAGNNYYCFGCGAHGDVISLTRQIYGLDFKEAVKMLQN